MRLRCAALAACSLAPIVALTVAFPEGGTQPFVASAFYPAFVAVAAIGALLPREQRALRIGALLYALALLGAYVVPSAVGGNVDRLGALAAGPLAACALLDALAALAPDGRSSCWSAPLLYWQVNAPLTDYVSTVSNPAVEASYYAPAHRRAARAGRRLRRAPGAHRGRPDRRSLGGPLRRPGGDDRARLGAPARPLSQPALLRRRRRPRCPPTACGWRPRRSPTSRCPTPRSTTRARPRRRSCARRTASRLPARSLALDALAAVRRRASRSRWPSPPQRLLTADTDSFALHAPFAGAYTVRLRFTPLLVADERQRLRRGRARRLDRGARRAARDACTS